MTPRRLWLGFAMLAAGGCLIGAAAGNSAGSRSDGVFKAAFVGTSTSMDPQVGYVTTTWTLEYATAAKLFNYPDKPGPAGSLLRPEVASGYSVSKDGKTYTFMLRRNFRFSDGMPVTCENFRYAIDRAANHTLQSPAAGWITDPAGTFIVGADRVNAGYTNHVSGVACDGDKLTIRLEKPDGTFLSKITMPFFQATSTKLPLTKEVVNVHNMRQMPTAGPYAFSLVKPDVATRIVLNPYWKPGGLGHERPRHLRAYTITWNVNQDTTYLQTLNNEYDEGPLPPADVQQVARKFGVNKTRFWVEPLACTGFVAFNTRSGLLADNPEMRKAISWALDRTDYVTQVGLYGGSPWTDLLPPGFPGSPAVHPYSYRANLDKARALAAGHFGDGKIIIWYRSSGTVNPNQAQIVKHDLIRLGFRREDISVKGFPGGWEPPPGTFAWDLATSQGWCQDYPDPSDFLQILFPPEDRKDYYSTYFANEKYERKFRAASKLVGNPRYEAFRRLDRELMTEEAPLAAMRTYNNRYLFSDRVDPRSLVYNGVYTDFDIAALRLKR